jgi:hypothetical protein
VNGAWHPDSRNRKTTFPGTFAYGGTPPWELVGPWDANRPSTAADAALSNDRNLLRPVLPVAGQPEKVHPGRKRPGW